MRIDVRSWSNRLTVVLPLLLLGCAGNGGFDVELDLYEPIPQVGELDFTTVEPAGSWLRWELRWSWGGGTPSDSVIGAGGPLVRDGLPESAQEAFATVAPLSGFAGSCLPAWCFKYVVAAAPEGTVRLIHTVNELQGFLGSLDSLAEAVILLDAAGYTWYGEGHGIRAVASGWEAVVFELVRTCDPVQTDRVLVRVRRDGEVVVGPREVWNRTEGACI